jgi:hypothetical protein
MNRAARLTIAFTTGCLGAYAIMAEHSHFLLFKSFNERACDQQSVFKVSELKLPTNGNPSYDSKTRLCAYHFINTDNKPDKITWKPS